MQSFQELSSRFVPHYSFDNGRRLALSLARDAERKGVDGARHNPGQIHLSNAIAGGSSSSPGAKGIAPATSRIEPISPSGLLLGAVLERGMKRSALQCGRSRYEGICTLAKDETGDNSIVAIFGVLPDLTPFLPYPWR